MNEEIMDVVGEGIGEVTDIMAVSGDTSGVGKVLKIIGIVAGIGGVITLVVIRNKDKIKKKKIERSINQLKKEGYIVRELDAETDEEILNGSYDKIKDE